MYQATMVTINAEQNRDMREQAAAWRRTHETCCATPARRARPFVLITRRARSLAGRERQHGPAAA
jgi:hypothetical protein